MPPHINKSTLAINQGQDLISDLTVSLLKLSGTQRKDLMWKPLMRLFRRYLRQDALSIELYDQIREQ